VQKKKRSAPVAVTLLTAGLKEIFALNADWHTGNASGAAFSLPQRCHLMSARNAMKFAHLSMLPVIHLIAVGPVILIHVYRECPSTKGIFWPRAAFSLF
jgi:hypothetical protein